MGEIDNIRIYHAHIKDIEDKVIEIIKNNEEFRQVIDSSDKSISSGAELSIQEGTYQVKITITNTKNGNILQKP